MLPQPFLDNSILFLKTFSTIPQHFLYTSLTLCWHFLNTVNPISYANYTIFRQHAASIYGFIHQLVSLVCQKKIKCPFVWLHCGCVPPPHTALGIFPVFFPCMLPTPLCGIFKMYLSKNRIFDDYLLFALLPIRLVQLPHIIPAEVLSYLVSALSLFSHLIFRYLVVKLQLQTHWGAILFTPGNYTK